MPSDNELLALLKRGDETAWEEVFRKFYPGVHAAARHSSPTLDSSEVEDVAIEALSELAKKVSAVRQLDELRILGITIAARRAISLQRKKYAEKRGSNRTDSLERLNEETEGIHEPSSPVNGLSSSDLDELGELLREAMTSLDPLTQNLIRDFLLNGTSYRELSEKHKVPIGTVGVHLSRGLKQVRERLKRKPVLLKELRAFLR